MEKSLLEKSLNEYIEKNPGNYITADIALRPELAGMKIFDEPVYAYVASDDPVFNEFKKPGIIGAHYMGPKEWLPGAKSVIAIFLPFTQAVREANRKNMDWPADEWLHARIEGQAFMKEINRFLISMFEKEGFAAHAPMLDPRMSSKSPVTENREDENYYTSNWSERHTAYAAGLGTFCLSKSLITSKGTAGRFTSIICNAEFDGSGRPYKDIYDYCIKCGACARNCPVKAISAEKGKVHFLCGVFLDDTRKKYDPRYGCGKCQVKVPCESANPNKKFQ